MKTGEDNWGPWADGIDRTERLARVRSLRALAHARFGIDHPLVKALYRAESLRSEPLKAALFALNAVPSRDQRNLVSLYGAMLQMRLTEDIDRRAS